jgi:hypothetical protein
LGYTARDKWEGRGEQKRAVVGPTFHELVYHALHASSIDFFLGSIGAENMIECKVSLEWYDDDLLRHFQWC